MKYEYVNIKFEDDLKGNIEFMTRNRRELDTITRRNLTFISNINPLYNNFRIKFIPMIEVISNSIGENPTGKFLRLMVDIREINNM